MENSSLTMHLQQAWLQAQKSKKASSPTIASFDASNSTEMHKETSFATEMGLGGLNLLPGLDEAYNSGSGVWNFQALQQGPSIDGSGVWNSHETVSSFHLALDDWAAQDPGASADTFLDPAKIEEDTLMDPALQYMNDILMEEEMVEKRCMLQDCTAYYAMAKGFYEILGEAISPLTSSCTSLSPSDSPDGDDGDWIDEALNVESQGVADVLPTTEIPSVQTTQNGSLFSPQRVLDSLGSGSESDGKIFSPSQWSFDSSGSSSAEISLYDAPMQDFGLQVRLVGNAFELNGNLYERGCTQSGRFSDPVLPEFDVQESVLSNNLLLDGNHYENAHLQSSGLPESHWHNFGVQDNLFINVSGSNGVLYGSAPSNGVSNPLPDSTLFQDVKDSLQYNGMYDAMIPDFNKNLLHVKDNLHLLLDNREEKKKIMSANSNKVHENARLSQTSLQSYLQGSVGISENGHYVSATLEKHLENVGLSQKVEKHRGNNGQQSHVLQPPNVRVKPPSPCLSSDKNTISFVQNENLKAEILAARLYREGPLPIEENEDHQPNLRKHNSRETTDGLSNRVNGKRTGKPVTDMIDLRALLVSCAQAVAVDDLRKANEILQEIRQHSSPHGNGAQRLAHYFAEALVARLSGTGARLYTVFSNNRPSAADLLKAYRVIAGVCPFIKLGHYFANQCILKAAEGVSRLHIVDYGIAYGIQWPCLISALSERKGGPPCLRITGIDFPHPGMRPAERVEETGRRLAEYAKTYGVPFEYHAFADKWENIQPSSLNLRGDELLVVNCMNRLRHLIDESVIAPSPRKTLLSKIRSMKPTIFVEGVVNASFNAPFFVSRFREALFHYSSKFDMLDTNLEDDNAERIMIEKEVFGRDIINIVACEGTERIERAETYRQWQSRTQRAGFKLLPLDPTVMSKSQAVVKKYYHKDYSVDEDGRWMLLNWKGRIMYAVSSWKPTLLNGK